MLKRTPDCFPTQSRIALLRAFLSRCFSNPWQTGAISPSGRALAVEMARQVLPYERGTIVELGSGTGSITAALLDLGVSVDRLYLVERSPVFAAILRVRFPGIRVVEGDALRLSEYAERDGVKDVAVVVSGLPLRLIRRAKRAVILRQSFDVMEDSGSFIQFTYNHRPPIAPSQTASLGLEASCLGFIWRNLPPASIWRFRRSKSSLHSAFTSGFRLRHCLVGHDVSAARPVSPFDHE